MSGKVNKHARLRWRSTATVLGLLALLATLVWWVARQPASTHPARVDRPEPLTVILPPPPPPPKEPPPPREEPKPAEPEMLLQEPVAEETPETPPVPEAPPGPDLGPGVTGGNGPATGNGGGGNGRIGSSGRSPASRYGWYAAQVQRSIRDALLNDTRTRSQTMNLRVRIWADPQGRILRAALSRSSGNPSLDAHLKQQLLPGLKLSAPPPDMPMPIHLNISSSLPSR